MAKTKLWAMFLIILTTGLTSFAQILYKKAWNQNPETILVNGIGIPGSLPFYTLIFSGLSLYGLGFVFMSLAFKGGEVTVLYPIFASSYVWVVLLSNYYFVEPITLLKIIGVLND